MDVAVFLNGHSGTYHSIVPIDVMLENNSSQQINASLQFKIPAAYSMRMGEMVSSASCAPEVGLPAGAKKKYRCYVFLPYTPMSIVTSLKSGTRVIATKEVKLNRPSFHENSLLLAVVGNDDLQPLVLKDLKFKFLLKTGSHDNVMPFGRPTGLPDGIPAPLPGPPGMSGMSELGMPGMPPPPTGSASAPVSYDVQTSVISIEAGDLPDRWISYASVDVLILNDFSSAKVPPETLSAIKNWVSKGGTLVVFAGSDYKKLQDTNFYADLLPVKIVGAGQGGVVPEMDALYPGSRLGPIALTKTQLIPQKAVYTKNTSNGILYSIGEYGEGSVCFVAFDINSRQFRDWPGQGEFWKHLLSRYELFVNEFGVARKYHVNNASDVVAFLENSVSETLPSLKSFPAHLIWIFLGIYIIAVVPLNYSILKERRKPDLAWYSIPILAIIFFGIAYGMGYSLKGKHIIFNQISVLFANSGDRTASFSTAALFFSPSRSKYDFRFENDTAVGYIYETNNPAFYSGMSYQIPSNCVFREGGLNWDDVKVAMWSGVSMAAYGEYDLAGTISGELSEVSPSFVGSITNNTPKKLTNCILSVNGSTAAIADIPAGATIKVDVKPEKQQRVRQLPNMAPKAFQNDSDAALTDTTLRKLTELVSGQGFAYLKKGTYLFASTESNTLFRVPDKNVNHSSVCRILVKLSSSAAPMADSGKGGR